MSLLWAIAIFMMLGSFYDSNREFCLMIGTIIGKITLAIIGLFVLFLIWAFKDFIIGLLILFIFIGLIAFIGNKLGLSEK